MGITFRQLYSKLVGAVDVIPVPFAQSAVNDALRHIYDERDWGFLWKNGIIRTPAIIEGTAATEKFSKLIPLDDDVKAAIEALDPNDVPLEERQIRFFGSSKTSSLHLYNIEDYDS